MLKKDVFEIFIKTLCLYFLINSIQIISTLTNAVFLNNMNWPVKYLVLYSIIYLLAAIILWFSSPFLSTKLIKAPDKQITSEITKGNLQYVVFSSIGLCLIVLYLPKLLGHISIVLFADPQHKEWHNIDLMNHILNIMVGLILVLGASNIVKLLNKIHELGNKSKDL